MSGKIIQRETMVAMLRAAIDRAEFRFARQAALAWLAAFPGDQEVNLLQAQVLIGEGKSVQAVPVADLAVRRDPFSPEAYRILALACRGNDPARFSIALSNYFVLIGRSNSKIRLEAWAAPLREAFLAYRSGRFDEAGKAVQEAIGLSPDLLLAAALHLLIERGAQGAEQETAASQNDLSVSHLAEIYHNRWPDCLAISHVLAELYLELGREPEAVRLLHICAAQDSTGSAARRLWGDKFLYLPMLPEQMVIHFDLPVPAAVAAHLGWNQLVPGEIQAVLPAEKPALNPAAVQTNADASPPDGGVAEPAEITGELPETAAGANLPNQAAAEPAPNVPVEEPSRRSSQKPSPEISAESSAELIKEVESEFDQLAKKLKQPDIGRADRRFPVYVIFSVKEALVEKYGPQTTEVLTSEIKRLQSLVNQRPGWSSIVYYPDDPTCTGQYGLLPVISRDPWRLKNALTDLDCALSKRGQMIGALLIVGGDEIVPYHRLPNPTDDVDSEVYSDSPYATTDANYFVPEWPVGRLPGEAGPDALLLLEQLRLIQYEHEKRSGSGRLFGFDLRAAIENFFARFFPRKSSFGYTAAAWRRSSLAVFRPIGAPHTVLASPPAYSGSIDPKLFTAGLGYYNLHGLEDSPSWYGQPDPAESSASIDYPVALSPEDLHRNGRAPRIIFSEACYGGHVFGKTEKDSLALKFISMGTHCVVASTCIAYGSINTPLVAADLLGNLFWQHLKSGQTAGEAFVQAKVDLVREMNRRQNYLDGEDQKTLISFVLYGDPLATYDGFRVNRKGFARSKDHPMVRVVSDKPEDGPVKVSPQVISHVKGLVKEYLPGSDLAEMRFCRQQPSGAAAHHSAKSRSGGERLVVTASKQVKVAKHLHRHYIRVTIDEAGNPVKMSISR